jgi:dTDP-4-amino-4,6-dideoxygalactose transaminase
MDERLDFVSKSTEVSPLSEESIELANKVLKSGQLFRYGECNADGNYTALLEQKFASMMSQKYAIAVNSGGSAIYLALKSLGIGPKDRVGLNEFTLAPVPGAIENTGAEIVLFNISDHLVLDTEGFEKQLEISGVKAFVLSHMRGHVADLITIQSACENQGVFLIEDCAHTTGAQFNGQPVGSFGIAGCFSFQTYKQLNGGEGGIITTNDEDLAARAILFSGSYMLYEQHKARPPIEVFEKWKTMTPNYSLRLNELTSAILIPQLDELKDKNQRWREIYGILQKGINMIDGLQVIQTNEAVLPAPTSFQFIIDSLDKIPTFIQTAKEYGLNIKWFGADQPIGFTSNSKHWGYLSPPSSIHPSLQRLCDIRIPVTLTDEECHSLLEIIRQVSSKMNII